MDQSTNIWAEVSLFHICSFLGISGAVGAHRKAKLMHRDFMIDSISSVHIYLSLLHIQVFSINSYGHSFPMLRF